MAKVKNPFDKAYKEMVAEIEKAEGIVEMVKVYRDHCNDLERKLDRLSTLISGGVIVDDQTK